MIGVLTNPYFMDKEDVERLCSKSRWCTRSKWRWLKICRKHNRSWQDVEKEMDKIIEEDDKKLQRLREKYNERKSDEQLGNAGEGSKGPGDQGEVQPSTERGASKLVGSGKPNRTRHDSKHTGDGEEVRQGQAENGSTTTEGAE